MDKCKNKIRFFEREQNKKSSNMQDEKRVAMDEQCEKVCVAKKNSKRRSGK